MLRCVLLTPPKQAGVVLRYSGDDCTVREAVESARFLPAPLTVAEVAVEGAVCVATLQPSPTRMRPVVARRASATQQPQLRVMHTPLATPRRVSTADSATQCDMGEARLRELEQEVRERKESEDHFRDLEQATAKREKEESEARKAEEEAVQEAARRAEAAAAAQKAEEDAAVRDAARRAEEAAAAQEAVRLKAEEEAAAAREAARKAEEEAAAQEAARKEAARQEEEAAQEAARKAADEEAAAQEAARKAEEEEEAARKEAARQQAKEEEEADAQEAARKAEEEEAARQKAEEEEAAARKAEKEEAARKAAEEEAARQKAAEEEAAREAEEARRQAEEEAEAAEAARKAAEEEAARLRETVARAIADVLVEEEAGRRDVAETGEAERGEAYAQFPAGQRDAECRAEDSRRCKTVQEEGRLRFAVANLFLKRRIEVASREVGWRRRPVEAAECAERGLIRMQLDEVAGRAALLGADVEDRGKWDGAWAEGEVAAAARQEQRHCRWLLGAAEREESEGREEVAAAGAAVLDGYAAEWRRELWADRHRRESEAALESLCGSEAAGREAVEAELRAAEAILTEASLTIDALIQMAAEPPAPRRQLVYVAKHGQSTGAISSLTESGVGQAEGLADRLAALPAGERPSLVVSSPSPCCLETAKIVADRLHCGAVYADFGLVCALNPQVTKADREPAFGMQVGSTRVAQLERPGNSPPQFPEAAEAAVARMDACFAAIGGALGGAGAVLIGDSNVVARAVRAALPAALVLETSPCGFVVLERGDRGWLPASASGQSGVIWNPDGGTPDQANVVPVADAPSSPLPPETPAPQHLHVLRHGERLDEVDTAWAATAPRPFDPPLTDGGVRQAREVGRRFAAMPPEQRPEVVVSSPFLRCMQTAAEVVAELGGSLLHVDWGLAEVHNPNILKWQRPPELSPKVSDLAARVPLTVCPLDGLQRQPPFPESLADAQGRYAQSLRRIAGLLRGRSAVLVTHGHCVEASVCSALRGVTVYETRFCSYATLRQRERGWEMLTGSGETGVSWLCDDPEYDAPAAHHDPVPAAATMTRGLAESRGVQVVAVALHGSADAAGRLSQGGRAEVSRLVGRLPASLRRGRLVASSSLISLQTACAVGSAFDFAPSNRIYVDSRFAGDHLVDYRTLASELPAGTQLVSISLPGAAWPDLLQQLFDALDGDSGLWITHTTAVQGLLIAAAPGATVYNVDSGGVVLIERSASGVRVLTESGESGVGWGFFD